MLWNGCIDHTLGRRCARLSLPADGRATGCSCRPPRPTATRPRSSALLEILDDQRFARGVTADPAAVRDTVVCRLKRDVVDADGTRLHEEVLYAGMGARAGPISPPGEPRRGQR